MEGGVREEGGYPFLRGMQQQAEGSRGVRSEIPKLKKPPEN